MRYFIASLLVLISTQSFAGPSAAVKATYQDIEKTLGMVPDFLKSFPEDAVVGAWEEMKNIQLNPDTAIPGRIKELIGLGVSAQIPCHYCTYFHTKAAKMAGATDNEIKEALAVAAQTRHWSTFVNGTQLDETAFRNEVDQMVQFVKLKMDQENSATGPSINKKEVELNSSKAALDDIAANFGFVPTFLNDFPREGLVGAWKELKEVMMNQNSYISSKYKDLISLGISAQIPCRYCVYVDNKFGKINGATDRQIKEAVAIASLVRHWSTYLNGMQVNEAAFKRNVDQMFRMMKMKSDMKKVASN